MFINKKDCFFQEFKFNGSIELLAGEEDEGLIQGSYLFGRQSFISVDGSRFYPLNRICSMEMEENKDEQHCMDDDLQELQKLENL